jgi:hypothetical protein
LPIDFAPCIPVAAIVATLKAVLILLAAINGMFAGAGYKAVNLAFAL